MSEHEISGLGMTSQRARQRLLARLQEEGIANWDVLGALHDVPRHLFIDEALAHRAYEDTALPIGLGQTISQPYIVARMSELLLGGRPLKRVLEIGTGSGYQTAVLAQIAEEVYTVERIKALQEQARQRHRRLDLKNIHYRYGDGWQGWAEHAPYDGIIVTAAPDSVPPALLEQLAVGGRLITPVGRELGAQELRCITRNDDGFDARTVEQVRFVPLVPGTTE
ncbi:MAG: protein-L-isoaspartate(D-aspartate) O-methyltransferase [Gammaproteobacteria bacterium]|nr:protein-L-isoaspartate(D-aspartate) O-methyltransferase [Gammaproteobacteria bacterium]